MLIRILIVVAVLTVASVAYLWWQRQQGKVRHVEVAGALTPAELGAARGPRGSLVQFSTPVCAKCPGTRVLLKRVIEDYPGVVHIDIDAAEQLDMARRLDIMRTPTTLVLDADGVVISRMDGPPTVAQVREALDELPPARDYDI